MTLSTKIIAGFGSVLLLIVVLAYINKRFSGYVAEDVKYLGKAEESLRLNMELRKLLHAMENGLNGYLLYGDSASAASYHIASGKFDELHRQGAIIVGKDFPAALTNFNTAERYTSRWRNVTAKPLILEKELSTTSETEYLTALRNRARSNASNRILVDSVRAAFNRTELYLYGQRERFRDELELSLYRSNTIETVLAGFILLIGLILAIYASRHISSRMNSMIGMAETISSGNFSIKVNDSGSDEMSRLAASLNRMTQAIEYSFGRLENANRKLSEVNKDLERVAFLASHDLKEPVRMISIYTQLLENHYGDKLDDKAKEYMHFSIEGSQRVIKMLADLLEYVKVTQAEMTVEAVDMAEAERLARNMYQEKLDKAGAVVTTGELPVLNGHPQLLPCIFEHLYSNAIKFRSERKLKIDIRAEHRNHEWIFSFADNGIGMDEQYSERVFTVFQRLNNRTAYTGNGIGLSLSKKIVEIHGGRIWFQSVPGEGATIFFALPENPAHS